MPPKKRAADSDPEWRPTSSAVASKRPKGAAKHGGGRGGYSPDSESLYEDDSDESFEDSSEDEDVVAFDDLGRSGRGPPKKRGRPKGKAKAAAARRGPPKANAGAPRGPTRTTQTQAPNSSRLADDDIFGEKLLDEGESATRIGHLQIKNVVAKISLNTTGLDLSEIAPFFWNVEEAGWDKQLEKRATQKQKRKIAVAKKEFLEKKRAEKEAERGGPRLPKEKKTGAAKLADLSVGSSQRAEEDFDVFADLMDEDGAIGGGGASSSSRGVGGAAITTTTSVGAGTKWREDMVDINNMHGGHDPPLFSDQHHIPAHSDHQFLQGKNLENAMASVADAENAATRHLVLTLYSPDSLYAPTTSMGSSGGKVVVNIYGDGTLTIMGDLRSHVGQERSDEEGQRSNGVVVGNTAGSSRENQQVL